MSVKLKQLGPNQTSVEIGDVTLYFSYETCVAVHRTGHGYTICENVWGATTGKHLALINGAKSPRTPRAEFVKQLDALGVCVVKWEG
jgi:hypothetical protein